MKRPKPRIEELLAPADVAKMFNVDPKTVTRWARSGKIPDSEIIRTPGGHRRFRGPYIRAMLNGGQQ